MKMTLLTLTLVLSSLGFAKSKSIIPDYDSNIEDPRNQAELVCKSRSKATALDEVGKVVIKPSSAESLTVKVGEVTGITTKSDIDYNYDSAEVNKADLNQGLVNNKIISFKRVPANKALATTNYFVYIKKSFPSRISFCVFGM